MNSTIAPLSAQNVTTVTSHSPLANAVVRPMDTVTLGGFQPIEQWSPRAVTRLELGICGASLTGIVSSLVAGVKVGGYAGLGVAAIGLTASFGGFLAGISYLETKRPDCFTRPD